MALFTSLVFLKIFHWLSQLRIEFVCGISPACLLLISCLTVMCLCIQIEQTELVTRTTHVRLVGLMTMLAAVDLTFVVLCGMKVMDLGPSVFILFGFEVPAAIF